MSKGEKVEGIVNQKITADLVLDMYEKYKKEKTKSNGMNYGKSWNFFPKT